MGIGDEVQEYYRKLVERTDELERVIDEAAGSRLARILDLDEEIATAGAVVIAMLRNQIIPQVKKVADTVSMSDVLRDHKQGWSTIGSGALKMSDSLEDEANGIRAQVHWAGSAANAYEVAVGNQQKSVEGLSTAAQAIEGSLDAVASALDVAGYTIIPGISVLVLSIVGAIVSAATVVGLPAALAFILTTAAGFLASVSAIIAGLVTVNDAQSDQAAALARALAAQGDWKTPNLASFANSGDWVPA
ncbi:hypothetical protein [Mycobacterium asiaticum]|uniref:hypothetical protein n=1 Tax=Mycobacterium asiaticum TaxID=1790 RepID=UPI0007EF6D0A|nr:hypothetical protein [Mycobacterium asiaticum]OBJ66711.1 hypothetical protein A9W94_06740 [Mycobacterium asiaticum]